jgi:WD40 repeat protein
MKQICLLVTVAIVVLISGCSSDPSVETVTLECKVQEGGGMAFSQETDGISGTITFIRLPFPKPFTVEALDLLTGKTCQLARATADRPVIRTFQYSPDGTKFVVDMGDILDMEIYLGDNETGNLRRLTDNDIYDAEPAFSPDGKRIAFTRGGPIKRRIYIHDLDSGRERVTPLPAESVGTTKPQWVGDKEHLISVGLAHLDDKHPNTLHDTLAEIDLANDSAAIFYKNPYGVGRAQLSPDSSRLACVVQKPRDIAGFEYSYRIHSIDLRSKELRPVDCGPGPTERDGSLAWSGDGTFLAWIRSKHRDKKHVSKLMIHDFEKRRTRTVALPEPATEAGRLVCWSPDGKYVACLTSNKDRTEHNLLLVSMKDKSVRKVLTDSSPMQLCSWR